MLPLIGVVDLELGDLVRVADAPLLRIPLGSLHHSIKAAGPHPDQTLDSEPDGRRGDSPRRTAALADAHKTIEPSPTFCISTRLRPTSTAPAGDCDRLTRPWLGPPDH